jgi:hypothetical protein
MENNSARKEWVMEWEQALFKPIEISMLYNFYLKF